MEKIAGHTFDIAWASGVPIVRSRLPVSGYNAFALVNTGELTSCSGNYPVLSTSYNSSGDLTWSVSNITDLYLEQYCVQPCTFSFSQGDYILQNGYYYGDKIYPEIINNSASGYIHPLQQGCAYSVYANNKCCGKDLGCGAPNCCTYTQQVMPIGIINGVSTIDYGIINDSNHNGIDDINGNSFCKDYNWLCWKTTGGYNSQVSLNGMPVEPADCLLLRYGSSREKNYQLSVTTECGTVALCNYETPCCSRKDYYILQVTGFEDLNYTIDNPDFSYSCPSGFSQPGFASSSGSTNMTLTFNLSELNGTYIIPLCHQTSGDISSCGSKVLDTGIEVTATWTRNQSWHTEQTQFGLGCTFRTITDAIENSLFSVKFKVYATHQGLFLGDGIVTESNYSIYNDENFNSCDTPTTTYITRGPYAGNQTYSYTPFAGCDSGVGDWSFRILEFPKCDEFPGYGVSSYNINGVYDFALDVFGNTQCYRQSHISCPGGFTCYGSALNPAPPCLINEIFSEIHPLAYSIDLL